MGDERIAMRSAFQACSRFYVRASRSSATPGRVAVGVTVAGTAACVLAPTVACDDGSDDSWLPGPLQSVRDGVNGFFQRWTDPSRELLLPGWPAQMGAAPRTLVLDLDETLVSTSWDRTHGWRTKKRPYLDKFLATLSQHYEIVIFSCGLVHTVDPVLSALDPNTSLIMYRLYRDSTVYRKGQYIKDLSRLNRDLTRVVMLDDEAAHVQDQPENAIVVPAFNGENDDTVLLQLIPFLEGLVKKDVPDVREEIKKYRRDGGGTNEMLARLNAEALELYEEKQEKIQTVRKLPGSRIWTESQAGQTAPVVEQMRKDQRAQQMNQR